MGSAKTGVAIVGCRLVVAAANSVGVRAIEVGVGVVAAESVAEGLCCVSVFYAAQE